MESEDEIIPLCLYSNDTSSYIALPDKVFKDNKVIYDCPEKEMDMKLIGKFYGIRPDIAPKPTFSDLICVKTNNGKIEEINIVYDPFDPIVIKQCLKFIVWLEPTPCTTPLYIFKNESDIYITFNKKKIPNDNYKPYNIPILYVLFDSNIDMNRINCKGKFDNRDGYPLFRFSHSYGRCIPDPESNDKISECMVKYNKLASKFSNNFPHLFTYLSLKYKNYYEKRNKTILIIFLGILVICLIVVIFKKMKKNRK